MKNIKGKSRKNTKKSLWKNATRLRVKLKHFNFTQTTTPKTEYYSRTRCSCTICTTQFIEIHRNISCDL